MIYKKINTELVVTELNGKYYVSVYMNPREVKGGYEVDEYHLVMPEQPTYNTLIAALVRVRYSSDDMEAIINNYLLDTQNPDASATFREMQIWRQTVKAFAKKIYNKED